MFETTFRDMFSRSNTYMTDAGTDKAPFHGLYNGVMTSGKFIYTVLFSVAIIFAVLACSIVVVKIYLAGSNKAVTEEKDKLQRNLLMVFFLVILGGIVTTVYTAFLW